MNVIIITGRLTADPILRQTQSGQSVASYTVAVDRFRGSGKEKTTDFINCVSWGKTGEHVAKWFAKGKPILVSGSLQTRKYTDKDGNNRVAVEVNATSVEFMGGDKRSSPVPERYAESSGELSHGDFDDLTEDDDDLPF